MDSAIWNHWVSSVFWSWSSIKNRARLGECSRSNLLSYQAMWLRCIRVKYFTYENRISFLHDPFESLRKFIEIHSRKRKSRIISCYISSEFRSYLQLYEDNLQWVSCDEDSNFQTFFVGYYFKQKIIPLNLAKCLKYVRNSWIWC